MTFRLTTRVGYPTFVDLPWETPLEQWDDQRLVSPVRGISRHVVRFVVYGGGVYALKETPDRVAAREYRLLRDLHERAVPVVDAVGVASGRTDDGGGALDAVLITRLLDHSLPYRALFSHKHPNEPAHLLLDALAELLVRLHLVGFFWGDCSLSNALFRRDAGTLAAYLVDAETGEVQEQLSDGQREHDLDLASTNIMGELLDVAAEMGAEPAYPPEEAGEELRRRYDRLWAELTRTEVVAVWDRHAIDRRLQRLNELGFDVEELQIEEDGSGEQLRVRTAVVEPGHHRRRLLSLTGIDAEENQARRLLNDLRCFQADLERAGRYPVPEQLAAIRWRAEVFEPAVATVPEQHRGDLTAAELYHHVLVNRWLLSEHAGHDVGTAAAVADFVERVLGKPTGQVPVVGTVAPPPPAPPPSVPAVPPEAR